MLDAILSHTYDKLIGTATSQQVTESTEHHSTGQQCLLSRVRLVARHKVDGVRRVAHLQSYVPFEVLLAVNRVEGHL